MPSASGAPRLALLVLAKAPVPGCAKTRLCPPLTLTEAAELAEAALLDTLTAVLATPVSRRVLILDGEPGDWLPAGIEVLPQRGGGLAGRLADAFADVGAPALLIGMDTPQVTPALLGASLSLLAAEESDAVLGLTEDGGYWAIGLRQHRPEVFDGVPMSVASTGEAQRRRLDDLGLRTAALPRLCDVDLYADAVEVAAGIPDSQLARRLAQILARPLGAAL